MPVVNYSDIAIFYFINQGLAHPWMDVAMAFFSGNLAFYPLAAVVAWTVASRGGVRGFALVLVSLLAVLVASNLVCAPLKEIIMRPRPGMTLDHVRLITGNGMGSNSMPSCHAANWGALAMVAWLFCRQTWKLMIPMALLVAVSRVYLGVHYPSDVIVGLLLGAGAGAAVHGMTGWLWNYGGRRYFPAWWAKCPTFRQGRTAKKEAVSSSETERTWQNATWLALVLLFLGRLAYIASDTIQLSEDEAYQWMWSKHLDWAYYSKPPLIAWVQWLGTHLWGDTAFGVRFFSPVLALAFGIMTWGFLRHRVGEQTAFWTVLVFAVTPLFAVGSTLLTVDAPTVFFYMASVLAMWRAMERDSTAGWLLAGGCMALGFLSKFFSPFLWVGLLLFLAWAPEFRRHLRRPGIWLALGLNLLGAVPVILWNSRHGWITLTHLQERGGLDRAASFQPSEFLAFSGAVAGLMNPVFFLAAIGAVVGFVRLKDKPALWRFLFCSSIPVFFFYLILSCRAKAQPNWIAPAVPALFLFAVLWWHARAQAGSYAPRRWLIAGLMVGLPATILLHDTRLLRKAVGITLSGRQDPLNRVRGGKELARVVQEQRDLLAKEGQPVFLIADHYGRASLLNFYLPRGRLGRGGEPIAYVLSTDKPQNQYWFWPNYEGRTGENALFVMNVGSRRSTPRRLKSEFASVEPLGLFQLRSGGRVCSQVQLFACRGKLPLNSPGKSHLTSTP